jgi:O-antigen/teichoic acid export membrane protein
MPNHKRKVFINTSYMTIGTLIERIFLFLITIIIARYLSKEQYGEYTTALGLATFFSLFANLNINTAIIKIISADKEKQNEYFTASLLIKSILSIIIYVSLIITLIFTNYSKNIIILSLILGIVRIVGEFIFTMYAFYEVREKFNITAIFVSTFSFLFLIGTILITTYGGDYFDIVNIRLFITFLFFILIFFHLKKSYSIIYNSKIIKNFLKEILPFSWSFCFQNILNYTAIILLPLIHGTIYAGIYQNAYIITASITFIFAILSRVLGPYLFKHKFHSNIEKYQFTFDLYSKIYSFVSFYLFMIFYLFSSDIILLLFGHKYDESIPALKIISMLLPFITIAPTIITAISKQKINSIIDATSAIVNIISSIFLIYFYKTEGACIAFILSIIISYISSNGYLVIKKFVTYKTALIIWLKLAAAIVLIYFIHNIFFSNYYFIISFLIDSLIYFSLVLCFILKKDDLRIIKEIFATGKS